MRLVGTGGPRGVAPGTFIRAEIEGDFPLGVDDHGVILDDGIVTYRQQPDGRELRIHFLDDATCTSDSEAGTFMIRHLLDAEALHRSGSLCIFYRNVLTYDPPPKNVETVLTQLAPAEHFCG